MKIITSRFQTILGTLGQRISHFFTRRPQWSDTAFLSLFVALITFQPFYLREEINIFEFGIYLPGINGILHGLVPYRDFFHLRGPLELYPPAWLMHVFGKSIPVLATYFYVGTVLGLIACVFIARDLLRTRLAYYLLIPVVTGRTFLRVVFTFWGGIRFALGLLSVLFIIYAYKRGKRIWIFWAGVAAALAGLTSLEIGLTAFLSVSATLLFAAIFRISKPKDLWKAARLFVGGAALMVVPYFAYLYFTHSLIPYITDTLAVIINLPKAIPVHFLTKQPETFMDVIRAMNPASEHFRHITPIFTFLFLGGYFIYRLKKKTFDEKSLGLACLAFYGVVMYQLAFRNMDAGQFEMALQPEKILLFMLLEEIFLFVRQRWQQVLAGLKAVSVPALRRRKQWELVLLGFVVLAFCGSSLGYSIARFDNRFIAFRYITDFLSQGNSKHKLIPLHNRDVVTLTLPPVRGMTVPAFQAEDIRRVYHVIRDNTSPKDPVFFFPQSAAYSFIVDRPFIGRFPMVTFSWLKPAWHEELITDLKNTRPKFAVVEKDPGAAFPNCFFKIAKNKQSYNRILTFIRTHYRLYTTTPKLLIYEINP